MKWKQSNDLIVFNQSYFNVYFTGKISKPFQIK